jgi:hypothetical protein
MTDTHFHLRPTNTTTIIMRFITIAVLLLSSSLVSAQRDNGRGNGNNLGSSNGKNPVQANPDVAPKIEALEAKVSPGQEKKPEDADGGKVNSGIPTPTANKKKRMTLRLSSARKWQNWRILRLTSKSSKP